MPTNAVSNNALSNMSGLSDAELQKRAQSLVDVKTGKISALSALDAALADATNVSGGQAAMANFTAAGSMSIDVHAIDDPLSAFNNGNKAMDGFAGEPPPPPQIGGPQAQLEKASKSGAKKMTGFCGCCPPPAPPPAPPPPAAVSPEKPSPVAATPPAAAAPEAPAVPAPARDQPTAPTAPGRVVPQGRRSGFGLDGSAGNPTTPNNTATTPSSSTTGPTNADIVGAQSEVDSGSSDMQFEILKMQVNRMSQIQDMMSNVVGAMSDEAMGAIRNVKAS